jgi:hypothetical protein
LFSEIYEKISRRTNIAWLVHIAHLHRLDFGRQAIGTSFLVAAMTSTSFYTLFESASGYALFSILQNEEIGSLLQEVQLQQYQLVVSDLHDLTCTRALFNRSNLASMTWPSSSAL